MAELAKTKSLEPIQLAACMETKATEAEVNKSQAEGSALGVNSTPTLFVNGRRLVGNMPWPQLKQIIEHEVDYQKTHGGSEKCCEADPPRRLQVNELAEVRPHRHSAQCCGPFAVRAADIDGVRYLSDIK